MRSTACVWPTPRSPKHSTMSETEMNRIDERAARAWCESLARTLPVQQIPRGGLPYLDRYFAAGWSPTNRRSGPAIFLHHFVASDPQLEVHSHPWGWSASLILSGGYREERCRADGQVEVREYHPGEVNVLRAEDQHRIDLLSHECWSVFLAGSFEKPWGFAPSCAKR
jgi:hypothetical protein